MLKYKDVYNMTKTAADLKAPVATATYPKAVTTNKSLMQTIFGNRSKDAFKIRPYKQYDPYSFVLDLNKYTLIPSYKGTYKVTSNAEWARKKRIALMSATLAKRRKSMFFGSRYPVESIPSIDEKFIQSPIK